MRYNMRQAVHSRFTESAAKFYICQILVAVSYCHKYSILHRGKAIPFFLCASL